VRRLKNCEDQESWRTFFETYWKLIYSVAIKAGLKDAEAQDVVQETTLSVVKQMPNFKADPSFGSFKGWLLNITRRRIVDQFRKRGRLASMNSRYVDSETATDAVNNIPDLKANELEQLWDKEWNETLLENATRSAREQVSAKQFQIFDLYVLKGWPVEKVEKFLKVSQTQVYLAKHRVGAVIKREVERLEKLMG
jgi:RNA polymerase sigma factor (sigma-70 family)